MSIEYDNIDAYDDESDLFGERGCVLGDKCLHHDPMHTADECFDLEYAEEYHREGMRTTEEYAMGVSEERDKILQMLNESIGTAAVNDSAILALKSLRGLIKGTIQKAA